MYDKFSPSASFEWHGNRPNVSGIVFRHKLEILNSLWHLTTFRFYFVKSFFTSISKFNRISWNNKNCNFFFLHFSIFYNLARDVIDKNLKWFRLLVININGNAISIKKLLRKYFLLLISHSPRIPKANFSNIPHGEQKI